MTLTKTRIKPKKTEGETLPVMELFYSVQGEGAHTGKAAFFIRLAGCDVGCHWCDVKDSWDADKHPVMSVKDIVEEVGLSGANRVIVTGGEPAMYDLTHLTTSLKKLGLAVHLETSGSSEVRGAFDWICLSPKKRKEPWEEVFSKADELKVVIYNKDDFNWAEKNAALVSKKCKLYLQPEWSKADKVMPLIVEYTKKHPRWQVSLQTHKYLGIR
ncbi:MAG TPA: 7-carboxy-7-deazaguanine synthase QueE [Bacteroidia bacterium]|nr:7-carboxy-7-deazaguanine synthase QueE [Bacteroidia bacterium]